ncbi:uncharacterized protein LOC132164808 [Corylus avellana]|uniref:uncharacterized protein LOC132164808 n=1 Tax=Corylus avellana TaxID=13451 RepID=UPI00286CE9CB|nr:uncharacterized protein LOC132164808 [Corylus avellana]
MNHRDFSDLLQHRTGFGWDPVSNTVQGTETQWQQYLRIKPKASRFRRKGCPNYEMLGLLFNGSTATGVLRHSSARTPPGSDEEDELNEQLLRFGMHVSQATNAAVDNSVSGEFLGSVGGSSQGSGQPPAQNRGIVIGGNGRGKRPVDSSGPSTELKRKGKGKSHIDSLRSDALKEFTEVSRLKKEILLQDQLRMSSGEGSAGAGGSGASFSNGMSRAIGMLDEIAPDLDDDRYFRAFELFRDENVRNGFIALPPERKKAWIGKL